MAALVGRNLVVKLCFARQARIGRRSTWNVAHSIAVPGDSPARLAFGLPCPCTPLLNRDGVRLRMTELWGQNVTRSHSFEYSEPEDQAFPEVQDTKRILIGNRNTGPHTVQKWIGAADVDASLVKNIALREHATLQVREVLVADLASQNFGRILSLPGPARLTQFAMKVLF